jgi:hypothetical protein
VDEINPPKALAQEGLGEKKESAEIKSEAEETFGSTITHEMSR